MQKLRIYTHNEFIKIVFDMIDISQLKYATFEQQKQLVQYVYVDWDLFIKLIIPQNMLYREIYKFLRTYGVRYNKDKSFTFEPVEICCNFYYVGGDKRIKHTFTHNDILDARKRFKDLNIELCVPVFEQFKYRTIVINYLLTNNHDTI